RALDSAVPRPELRQRILSQIPVIGPKPVRKSFWQTWWPANLALAGAAAVCLLIFFTQFNRAQSPLASLDQEKKVAFNSPADSPKAEAPGPTTGRACGTNGGTARRAATGDPVARAKGVRQGSLGRGRAPVAHGAGAAAVELAADKIDTGVAHVAERARHER